MPKPQQTQADKFYARLYPGGKYPGWSVGPEYAEPAKPMLNIKALLRRIDAAIAAKPKARK